MHVHYDLSITRRSVSCSFCPLFSHLHRSKRPSVHHSICHQQKHIDLGGLSFFFFQNGGGGCLLSLLAFCVCIHIEIFQGGLCGVSSDILLMCACMGVVLIPLLFEGHDCIVFLGMAYEVLFFHMLFPYFLLLRVLASHFALALALASLCTGR
ncbi:hypothetical protein BDQ94DRAFT_54001 [Aspergillus welwitschiae]|uniref:Uncharacterized protein n=1 Tax=Aspergillus welwitschiae TaxID=1341132 RepID=A0A3F3PYK2_9EURO|nr:hypothetical protein BDQ94DRAFT_54001 [Aspergillus welwitschiae]RDH31989.1 hypothetical protein BDQ94DRAFT_54001 [Aspergillus welwitschiae]